jgi:hypothetical protein
MNQEPLATREQIALSFFNAETAMKFADKYHTADGMRKEFKRQIKAAWRAAEIWEETRGEIISELNQKSK